MFARNQQVRLGDVIIDRLGTRENGLGSLRSRWALRPSVHSCQIQWP